MTEIIERPAHTGTTQATAGAAQPAPIATLPGSWVRWLIENIDRGCSLASLATVMRAKGFDPHFALVAVGAIHDLHVGESSRPGTRTRCLDREWTRWLRENIQRGCTDEALHQAMCTSGFETALASNLLRVTRAYLDRPHPLIGRVAATAQYRPDPIRLASGNRNRVCIDGHTIHISSVMHNPCIAVLDHVLTGHECSALIKRASKRLKRSGVVDRNTGKSVVSEIRTSAGTHFERGDGKIVSRIENRLARLIDLEVERFEPMQILHYAPGGQYKAHQDYFAPDDTGGQVQSRRGGNRIATLLLYLNDVEEGGQTAFPRLNFEVQPRRGRAVYFEYMNEQLDLDTRCLHAGQPVLRGEKWIATKWVRADRYESAEPSKK